MSNVNGKYIKDENGNIFSPITSAGSVIGKRSIGGANINLQSCFDGDYQYSAANVVELNIPDLVINKGQFYHFDVCGSFVGNTGDLASLLLTPLSGVPDISRVNISGSVNNDWSIVTNDNFGRGLMIARAFVGNSFLYSGTICFNNASINSICYGGSANGNYTVNVLIRSILSPFNSSNVTGFKIETTNSQYFSINNFNFRITDRFGKVM